MPPNTSPIFVITPNCSSVEIITGNTARDGSGPLETLFTAGVNGSLVSSIVFNSAQATPAASNGRVCRVFITDTAGANPRLFQEVLLPGGTPSASVVGPTIPVTIPNGIPLKSGQLIRVCQSFYAGVADKTHAVAIGGDY